MSGDAKEGYMRRTKSSADLPFKRKLLTNKSSLAPMATSKLTKERDMKLKSLLSRNIDTVEMSQKQTLENVGSPDGPMTFVDI
jgi:hypothetical protein